MATIKFTGLDAYMEKLGVLERRTDAVINAAIYEGAGITADVFRSEILSLPTSMHHGKPWFGTPQHPARGPSLEQKMGLLDSLGITPVSEDGKGFINAHIGFDGYNGIQSARWPRGQHNQMVARAVNSGTSFMTATPFAKKAAAKSRPKAKAAMKKTAEKSFDELWRTGLRKSIAFMRSTGKHSWEK